MPGESSRQCRRCRTTGSSKQVGAIELADTSQTVNASVVKLLDVGDEFWGDGDVRVLGMLMMGSVDGMGDTTVDGWAMVSAACPYENLFWCDSKRERDDECATSRHAMETAATRGGISHSSEGKRSNSQRSFGAPDRRRDQASAEP